MAEFDKDTYRTPRYLVNWAKQAFMVNVDGCANYQNAVFTYFVGAGSSSKYTQDFLDFEPSYFWSENCRTYYPRFWVNPPYSNPLPFVKRAVELMQQGYFVVMLLPADKSTKWYEVIQQHATEVIDIIGGRVNFLHPITGKEVKGNNKGSMLAVFDPNMQGLITRQVSLAFIKARGGNES